MILTIDVGNSNTMIIGYDKAEKICEWRVETYKENTLESYKAIFENLGSSDIDAVIIACVVPGIATDVLSVAETVFKTDVRVFDAQTVTSFVSQLEVPEEIGADFVASSIAAAHKYGLPVIVADSGSATKLSLTNQDNVFCGGVILPGFGTSLAAFKHYLPHLPQIELVLPKKVIGSSTDSAIQSGVLYGAVAQIEGLARKIETEYGKPCLKILTGGYANYFKDAVSDFIFDADLVNYGMYVSYIQGWIR